MWQGKRCARGGHVGLMYQAMKELVRRRRAPSHMELMKCDCQLLQCVSGWFGPSPEALSTLAMACSFETAFLFANLDQKDIQKLVKNLYLGMYQNNAELLHLLETDTWLRDALASFDPEEQDELELLMDVAPQVTSPTTTAAAPAPAHTPNNKRRRVHWLAEEDQMIREHVAKNGFSWETLSAKIAKTCRTSRSGDALRNRFARLEATNDESSDSSRSSSQSSGKARSTWTREEDDAVLVLANRFGHTGWNEIARFLPGRTPHAIRNRASRLKAATDRTKWVSIVINT